MNGIFNGLEDFDVSFSDLDDSFTDPDFKLDSDFIIETVNNLSDREFSLYLIWNDGLSGRNDLEGILCLGSDDECEKKS